MKDNTETSLADTDEIDSVAEKHDGMIQAAELVNDTMLQLANAEQDNDMIKMELLKIIQRSENAYCADCHASNPKWASVTHGCTICTQCAGVHRSLGAHISYVMSCTLDNWTISQLELLDAVGNKKLNEALETPLFEHLKPKYDSTWVEREQFIRVKYNQQFLQEDTFIERSYGTLPCIGSVSNLQKQRPSECLQPRNSSSTYGMIEYIGVLVIEFAEQLGLTPIDARCKFELYIVVRLGEQSILNRAVKRNGEIIWLEKRVLLSWDGASSLSAEMYRCKRFGRDQHIGGIVVGSDLLQSLESIELHDIPTTFKAAHQLKLLFNKKAADECSTHLPLECRKEPHNRSELGKVGDDRPVSGLAKLVAKRFKHVKKLRSSAVNDITTAGIDLRLSLRRF